MLDITDEDIEGLDDHQLRELVGRLCEAELRHEGKDSSAVTWGGHQNAPDGGIDVRVGLPVGTDIGGFIPRAVTGFQVKAQDMSASAVVVEMRPQETLRQSIVELANQGGAYIIASAQGSLADTALQARRAAMVSVLSDLPNANALKVDFYDRHRLASWARQHPSVMLWLRGTCGRALAGWQPFGPWANPAQSSDSEYLIEGGIQIRALAVAEGKPLSTVEGLNAIREVLRRPQGIVRLVGLSGVGKTRLAQALFDLRIGQDALDATVALYTNINSGPQPSPLALASDLIATKARAILIIDNCGPALHSQLTEVAKTALGQLSVLTIEYDIREDQPEGTEVFEATVASVSMVRNLLRVRFPPLAQNTVELAADMSGGNARIAIALAEGAIRGGQSLGQLNSEVLFQTLFDQRQRPDQELLKIARGCALLYSFDGENTDATGELAAIGGLVGASVSEVYDVTATLLDRDLVQRRGAWRAVLPHALANRLAADALRHIPPANIKHAVFEPENRRLIRSFARRLGYLDTCVEAQHWVADWLSPSGILRNVWDLDEFQTAVFENAIPANPTATLNAIEQNVPARDANRPLRADRHILRAIRSIAYDPALFERCTALLRLIASRGDDTSRKKATEIHTSLFWIVLSGTLAPIDQRVGIARRLILSTSTDEQSLGYLALEALLKNQHFNSSYEFSFGARARDYGFYPHSPDDIEQWFAQSFSLVIDLARSAGEAREHMKRIVANRFRELWAGGLLHSELARFATDVIADGTFWRDGWQAIRRFIAFDNDKTSDSHRRLRELEVQLRPTDLVGWVRARALGSSAGNYDMDDTEPHFFDKRNADAEALGEALAAAPDAFRTLMPEIVRGPGILHFLGVGLARGADSPITIWNQLATAFGEADVNRRDTRVFSGMLSHLKLSQPALADELLESALTTQPLSPYFALIQSAVGVEGTGIDRLTRSLELGVSPTGTYRQLSFGSASAGASGFALAGFVRALAQKAGGRAIAIEILHYQFFGDEQSRRSHAPELILAGRELISDGLNHHEPVDDDALGHVIRVSLAGDDAETQSQEICNRLAEAFESGELRAYESSDLLMGLFKVQPIVALDAFLTGSEAREREIFGFFDMTGANHPHPLDPVGIPTLVGWADRDPVARYPSIARVIRLFTAVRENTTWNPAIAELIRGAPNPLEVAAAVIERLRPHSWSGSYASVLELNGNLLDTLENGGHVSVIRFVEEQKALLLAEAGEARTAETDRDRRRDERFEY
jgi:hypothetical protein